MPTTEPDPVTMLVQEVNDYLDVSHVGLYEFMWILNSERVPGTTDQRRLIARQALDRLLEEPDCRLISAVWAQQGTEADLGRDVEDGDFDDIPEDLVYTAITRD